jgi:predicted MFS family arabinose efflux permease
MAGGFLFDTMGAASPYWLGGAVMLVAFMFSLRLPRIQKTV